MLTLLFPAVGMRRARAAGDQLVAMRQMFLAFPTALVAFQVVLLFISPDSQQSNAWAIGLLFLGLLNCFVLRPLFDKPLRCDGTSLPGQYQTRMFVRIAFSESAAMFGFVGFFVAGVRWSYPIGALIACVGFLSAAPSRRNLARDQADLRRAGCNVSLVRALRGLDT